MQWTNQYTDEKTVMKVIKFYFTKNLLYFFTFRGQIGGGVKTDGILHWL